MPEEIESYMDIERERQAAFERAQWEQVLLVLGICSVGFLLGLMASHF